MRIAYLIGHYPAVTHTFIQREIQQLRRQGFEIETYSIWRAREDQLLTRVDRAEHENTYRTAATATRRSTSAPTSVRHYDRRADTYER